MKPAIKQTFFSFFCLAALLFSALGVSPANAAGSPPDSTADVVYGQAGSFTSNTTNNGGVSTNSLAYPFGMVLDGSGNLYVADELNNRVLYYPAGSATATRVYGQGGSFTTNTTNKGGMSADSLYEPTGVALDGSGNLYVADYGNSRVLYYPAGSTTATRVYGQGGSFNTNTVNKGGISVDSLNQPMGVALDGSGNLYVADYYNNRVLYYLAGSTTATRVYGQDGSFTTATINKGGISVDSLYHPAGVVLDGSGNLYVADQFNSRVLYYPVGSTTATRVFGQGGSFTTKDINKSGISADSLYWPYGMALDGSGNLYVADCSNNRVLYYPAGSTTATRVYGQGGSFTTDTINKGDISVDSFYYPIGVALDGSGNLYVADYYNNRVLKYAISSNANLSSLVLDSGALTPTFASGTTSYTQSVANAVTSLTVTPTVADATATVTVNGIPVVSGNASSTIALAVGPNTITTVVTAQDGTTTKTYTVTATRNYSIFLPLIQR